MRKRRSIHAVIGLACLLSAVFATTAPAQAASSENAHKKDAGQVLTVPASPPAAASVPQGSGGESALPAGSVLAEPPTTWPKANKIVHVPLGGSLTCDSGNLCVAAYDPTRGDVAVFFLYYCETYALSNFVGSGSYRNSQTGGAVAHFYGRTGNHLLAVGPGEGDSDYDWTPVWSIRNC
ncbi:hypothetical protein G4Z16_08540 [Streptomyces bathyalis]|uniref:Secreted protein n=1 Tax=Streptomyces bathyalis TaxID=2710756 RepID=A0A7T1T4X8_9ACTN|nr:hypothetical protein [Streptomyces bathyalis]QPP06437.1 hypothetical protein G4Z16_08540 [Streptomyces bathyalis]